MEPQINKCYKYHMQSAYKYAFISLNTKWIVMPEQLAWNPNNDCISHLNENCAKASFRIPNPINVTSFPF